MKKLLMVMVMLVSLVGCVFDSDNGGSGTSSTNSSSSVVVKKARLSINDPSLKRVVIDAPSNVITKREVKNDLTFGEYEEVSITWGEFDKKNYDFTYYLYSTTGAVRIDSVTFTDSLTFVNKYVIGNLITDKVGLTGDGMLPITYIGDTLSVNKKHYKRFHHRSFDSSVVMVVYGTDTTTNLPTKLQVNFAIKQQVKSVIVGKTDLYLYNSELDTINYIETYVDSLGNPNDFYGAFLVDRNVQHIYTGDLNLSWDVMSIDPNAPDSLKPKVNQIYTINFIKDELMVELVPEQTPEHSVDYTKPMFLHVVTRNNEWYIK